MPASLTPCFPVSLAVGGLITHLIRAWTVFGLKRFELPIRQTRRSICRLSPRTSWNSAAGSEQILTRGVCNWKTKQHVTRRAGQLRPHHMGVDPPCATWPHVFIPTSNLLRIRRDGLLYMYVAATSRNHRNPLFWLFYGKYFPRSFEIAFTKSSKMS